MPSLSTSADVAEISRLASTGTRRPLIVRVLGALRSALISVGFGFNYKILGLCNTCVDALRAVRRRTRLADVPRPGVWSIAKTLISMASTATACTSSAADRTIGVRVVPKPSPPIIVDPCPLLCGVVTATAASRVSGPVRLRPLGRKTIATAKGALTNVSGLDVKLPCPLLPVVRPS